MGQLFYTNWILFSTISDSGNQSKVRCVESMNKNTRNGIDEEKW